MPEINKRKDSHINLALESQVIARDERFQYEPLLGSTPTDWRDPLVFLGKKIEAPLWISSMTGGSTKGSNLNKLFASAAAKFGLGMGLGSCRVLLEDSKFFDDFNLRPIIGEKLPFYANLGIAQVEELIHYKKLETLNELIEKLNADGLIIHVNPLQEYFQPKGDKVLRPAIETIQELKENFSYKLIIKEVGQGMGAESLRKLVELGIDGVELAAHGGTNFTKLEGLRSENFSSETFSLVGHTAKEMVQALNQLSANNIEIIISGGINTVLDAHYLKSICDYNSVIGKAGSLLRYAQEGESQLFNYIEKWLYDFQLAIQFLKVKQ